MENSSLADDVWNNVTTSSTESDDREQHSSNSRHLVFKVVYAIIGTVGVLDNLFVIIVFALFIKITNKTMNILIVNQSILDMFSSLFLLLTTVIEVDANGMSRDSAWDLFLCRFWLPRMPMWCMMCTSTYGIVLTALERYTAVIYPIWYQQNLKVKKRVAYGVIGLIWNVITAFNIVIAIVSSDIVQDTCLPWAAFTSNAHATAVSVLLLLITYLLPLAVMVILYSRIVHTLRTKVGPNGSSAMNAAGRNAFVTSLMICVGFAICWTPNQVFVFIAFMWQIIGLEGWLYDVTVFMMFCNNCINPFIYAAKYRDFQQGVKRLVSKQSNQVSTANT